MYYGVVEIAKAAYNITKRNDELTDSEVAELCKLIALCALGNRVIDSKVRYSEAAISLMLSIALYEFPWFYQRHRLWQVN